MEAFLILAAQQGGIESSVARFFFKQNAKMGKIFPYDHNMYQMAINISKWP
jgi:hypothetical protein